MATLLSEFSSPTIPDLKPSGPDIIVHNALAGVLGAFSGDENRRLRILFGDFVRHVFGAMDAYRTGRLEAFEYVEGDRTANLAPYFRALNSFETSIFHAWPAIDHHRRWLQRLGVGDELRYFEPNDGSPIESLYDLHTFGSKHAYGLDIADPNRSEGISTSIWLTNHGIECAAGACIAYSELAELIIDIHDLWYQMQEKALQKRRAVENSA